MNLLNLECFLEELALKSSPEGSAGISQVYGKKKQQVQRQGSVKVYEPVRNCKLTI
jgi:hypothetical protein